MRKYSCSAPTVGSTAFAVVLPNRRNILSACLLSAFMLFKRGVFLSRTSPLYEQKAVGMNSVPSLTKAKEVGSHAVYPRASKVARMPPLGKEEASGSPRTSSFPEKSMMTLPSLVGVIKLSCFSAVTPVIGWNQCV